MCWQETTDRLRIEGTWWGEARALASARKKRGLVRRISRWRERRTVARALATIGRVESIVDCPCGTGAMWPTLSRFTDTLLAADASDDMLDLAHALHADEFCIEMALARAQVLPYDDASIGLVFCHRLLHLYALPQQRIRLLRELARVSARWVVFSVWTTGNWQHRRAVRRHRHREGSRVYLDPRQVRREAWEAGLWIRRARYKARGISPLVVCVAEKVAAT